MTFVFAGNLLRFVGYSKEIEVEETTLERCFDLLTGRFPALRDVLFDSSGRVRQSHQLFLNGEQLARQDRSDEVAMQQSLSDLDTVFVLTAIAGG